MVACIKPQLCRLIFFTPVIRDLIDPATNQEGNTMARPNYQFLKRQKELAKKKKKAEKKQRKLANKAIDADETQEDPSPSREDREA